MPSQPRLLMASSLVGPLPYARGGRTSETPVASVLLRADVLSPNIRRPRSRCDRGRSRGHARACNDSRNQRAQADAAKISAIVSIRELLGTFALVLDYFLLHRALGCQRSGTKR
jgi:hypothetical protein